MKISRTCVFLALVTGILALGGARSSAGGGQEVEWRARLGRILPVDEVVGSGLSFGLSVEWSGGKGGLLASIDLADLDSGAYGGGGFVHKTLGLAYTSRRVTNGGGKSDRRGQTWCGAGMALIDELDQVAGYTLFVGHDFSPGLMLEVRHSRASRWGFDYGGTNISLSWQLSRPASP